MAGHFNQKAPGCFFRQIELTCPHLNDLAALLGIIGRLLPARVIVALRIRNSGGGLPTPQASIACSCASNSGVISAKGEVRLGAG